MTLFRASHRKCWTFWLAASLVLFALSTTAEASLIGDEVRIQISSVDTTFEVASGVDPDYSFSSFNWNVESSSFVFWIANIPGGTLAPGISFTLSDLDFSPPAVVVDASVVAANGPFAGAMDDILTVGSDSIVVDLSSFAGGSLSGPSSMEITLMTEAPEPAAAAMFVVGGALLALAGNLRTGRP